MVSPRRPWMKTRQHLKVEWSAGVGRWAKIPWIALMDRRETTTTQQGVYCVYLFREDMSGVYLTLNQGVNKVIKELGPESRTGRLCKKGRETLAAGSLRSSPPAALPWRAAST